MKTCGAVLMLLCCCLAEPEDSELKIAETAASTQATCQPDIHTVLREMSALVAEQRVELRHTKTLMEAMEKKAESIETRLTDRLRASEKTVEALEARLRASENKAQSMRISFSTSLLASGSGNTGPFSVATPLVYRHVFTNVGNAYNPNTGVFTAPVRGVYNFVLFIYSHGHASTRTGVSLLKNGEHIVIAYCHHTGGLEEGSTGNGASLLLEVGDVVYVKLRPNCWVRDGPNHSTTFSGHLLFPM